MHTLLNLNKTLKIPFQFRKISTETLKPVKLAYATYENATTSQPEADPLLILHGLFGSKSNWNSLCKVYQRKTEPQRKIIAVDARNHGESAHDDNHTYAHLAADIRALYDDLNLKRAALLGHSMGGRALMLFALKYPELVDRLIVVDISPVRMSPSLNSTPDIFRALEAVNLPQKVTMSQARANVDEQLKGSIPDKGLRSFLLTNLVSRDNGSYTWRLNMPALLSNFNNLARFPLTNDLQYKGPVLFIGGSNSDYLLKSDFPKILQIFPNAELEYISGAGHWLHSEKPEEFLKLTLSFLNKSN